MNNINKIRIIFSILAMFFCFFSFQFTHADLPNPDYGNKNCNDNETMIVCRYNNIDLKFNECKKYDNDPNYRYLENSGSATAGEARYCMAVGSENNFGKKNNIFIAGFFVGLMTILALGGIVLLKKKNVHS